MEEAPKPTDEENITESKEHVEAIVHKAEDEDVSTEPEQTAPKPPPSPVDPSTLLLDTES